MQIKTVVREFELKTATKDTAISTSATSNTALAMMPWAILFA